MLHERTVALRVARCQQRKQRISCQVQDFLAGRKSAPLFSFRIKFSKASWSEPPYASVLYEKYGVSIAAPHCPSSTHCQSIRLCSHGRRPREARRIISCSVVIVRNPSGAGYPTVRPLRRRCRLGCANAPASAFRQGWRDAPVVRGLRRLLLA